MGMKGKFSKGSTSKKELMLTPLLDMFTIILIFLIVSFEAEDHGFEPNQDVRLPQSTSRSVFKPAVNVALTPEELLLEKEPVVELEGGEFADQYHEAERIGPFVDALEKRYAELEDDEDREAILLVQADRDFDYETLYLVLRSAAVAGFTKYRLVTMKK